LEPVRKIVADQIPDLKHAVRNRQRSSESDGLVSGWTFSRNRNFHFHFGGRNRQRNASFIVGHKRFRKIDLWNIFRRT